MDIFTVSFFGHRQLSDSVEIEKQLYDIVRDIIRTKDYVEFLVGRNGEFDILASSVIRRVMKESDYGNAAHILVLPYLTAEYRDNADSYKRYYSEVEICEQSAVAHFRVAIEIRNKAMVDRSDMVVCCIERKSGGAYKAVRYAEKRRKRIVYILH